MEYVGLGNTGLKVSRFSYGNWINCKEDAQEVANKLVKIAFDAGVNLFDTAEAYGDGQGEVQMGIALKKLGVPREDYVLTTKLFWGARDENKIGENLNGTSRKHIIEGLKRSLKLLQHDYVDIVFCHRYDHTTPVEEVCWAMKDAIHSGKALYWATSEWPGIRIMQAIYICDRIGAPRPIADQCEYNMYNRAKVEVEYAPLFDEFKYGTTTWSPLACGILTGKYNNGIPPGSRLDTNKGLAYMFEEFFGSTTKDKTLKQLHALQELATELGGSLPQLALAWVIYNKDVSTCILGATSEAQLQENLGALVIKKKITKEIESRIEKILGNAPAQEKNYFSWEPLPGRR